MNTSKYNPLYLKKNHERRMLSGHLWIFSNEIDTQRSPLNSFKSGELVKVIAANTQVLGVAYINPKTLLCARLLSRSKSEEIDESFLRERIQQALSLRQRLYDKPYYRLIFADSDFLPGLIVDRYGDTIVGQITTAGMQELLPLIQNILIQILQPKRLIWRNDHQYRSVEGLPEATDIVIGGDEDDVILEENDCRFVMPALSGQKTGWFYDHRDARAAIAKLAAGKKVLDVFTYLGAFAIPMAVAGAKEVVALDRSEKAIEYVKRNATLNQVSEKVKPLCAEAFGALEGLIQKSEQFEVIVLDPPAFIKKQKDIPTGTQAYQKLHNLALKLLAPNGILLTASCSMHLSSEALLGIVSKAANKAGRQMRIIQQLHQGMDHPIHPAIPETNYLKGFIVAG